MMGMGNDLVVESKGYCFLCLDEISSQFSQDGKPDQGSDSLTTSTCSLQSLSRFLGMDWKKVFHQGAEDLVPPQSYETIKNSKLKGELCEECGLLNANFGTLFQNLEKIKMEMVASLNQIFLKLLKGKATDKLEGLGSLTQAIGNSPNDWKGSLDVLRADAIEKCSRLLAIPLPRVKVQRLSSRGKNKTADKLKCVDKSFSDSKNTNCGMESKPQLEKVIIVKMESGNSAPSDQGDNYYLESNAHNKSSDRSTSEIDLITANRNNNLYPSTSKQMKREEKHHVSQTGPKNVNIPKSEMNLKTGKSKCSSCGSEFSTVRNYTEHYMAIHLNNKLKCNDCGKEFKSSGGYYAHRQRVHLGMSFPCPFCGRRYNHKSHLKRHQRVTGCSLGRATEPKKHTCHCQICGQGFTQRRGLNKHLREVHFNSREYVCDRCGKIFKRKDNLTAHKHIVDCRRRRK